MNLSSQNSSNLLLVELLTEELPPKALSRLAECFADGVLAGLVDRQLASADADVKWFATPRRLAVTVAGVLAKAADAEVEEKLMPVAVAYAADGSPSPALLKKIAAKGLAEDVLPSLQRRMDGKAEAVFVKTTVSGAILDEVLAEVVATALKKLPIPKMMRWGDTDHQFVRPVHGLVMLHGERVVPGELLGLVSGRQTRGHRFLSQGAISLPSAAGYAALLESQGKVVVDYAERRERIRLQLDARASELKATLNPAEGLLDEVTSLVEWPVVYVGSFDPVFLEVPQECLILTMQQNQKYFPLLNEQGRLIHQFLIVSNMAVDDPVHIVTGNARVVRPRLSDARFFFNQDRKLRLESRLAKLASVVYHNKLGTQLQRVERISLLAGLIAQRLHADQVAAERAARLAKADLVTDMVGEFPELQGVMGRYYAQADGERPEVADAIESHYRPRFAGDALPQGNVAAAVALADKLDALAGFFGIGQLPTGDKDPFGLRRSALGVLRLLAETPLPLALDELIADAAAGFSPGQSATALQPGFEADLLVFCLERLRGYLRDAGHAPDAIEAVLAQTPTRIDQVPAKLAAVRAFAVLPEAQALAAANKRIGNILKKSDAAPGAPDVALLAEPAERALFDEVVRLTPVVESFVANQDYADALLALAQVRAAVDRFFDEVMVNVDEPLVRANRLALLAALYRQLNAVADISRLAVQ